MDKEIFKSLFVVFACVLIVFWAGAKHHEPKISNEFSEFNSEDTTVECSPIQSICDGYIYFSPFDKEWKRVIYLQDGTKFVFSAGKNTEKYCSLSVGDTIYYHDYEVFDSCYHYLNRCPDDMIVGVKTQW